MDLQKKNFIAGAMKMQKKRMISVMTLQKKLLISAAILMMCLCVLPVQQARVQASTAAVSINTEKAIIWVKNYVALKINGTKDKVTWTSSDTKIAKVDKSGKVTGIAEGKATITATVGKKKYTCKITVKKEKDNSCLSRFLDEIIKKDGVDEKNSLIGNYQYVMAYGWFDVNNDGLEELFIMEDTEQALETVILTAINGKVQKAGVIKGLSIIKNKKYNTLCSMDIISQTVYLRGFPFYAYLHSYYLNNGILYENKAYHFEAYDGNYYKNKTKIKKDDFFSAVNKYYGSGDLTGTKPTGIIYLSQTSLKLKAGESSVLDVLGTKQEEWATSDASVITVDQNGKVNAIGAGTASISAMTHSVELNCDVTVLSEEAYDAPFSAKEVTMGNFRFILGEEWVSQITNDTDFVKQLYIIPESEAREAAFSNAMISVYDNSDGSIDDTVLKDRVKSTYEEENLEYIMNVRNEGCKIIDSSEAEYESNGHKYYKLTYSFQYTKSDNKTATGTIDVYAALYDGSYLEIIEYDYGNGPEFKEVMNYLLENVYFYKE